MKVVFLDIDGVLNTGRNYEEYTKAQREDPDQNPEVQGRIDIIHRHVHLLFDEVCIANLNSIISSTGAKIVVSSSWRHFYDDAKGRPKFSELVELLKRVGVIGEVIGKTPTNLPRRMSESVPRGKEIKRWLDENPGVESFVILDDTDDMASLRHKLVRTRGHVGLSLSDVDKALRHLGIHRLSARKMHLEEAEVQHGEAVRRQALRRGKASGSNGEEAGPDATRGSKEA